MTHNVTLASLMNVYYVAQILYRLCNFIGIRNRLPEPSSVREDSSSLASPDPECTAKARVLELELQGVTRADKGQDSCRLVTRDRNLPINQHDRSRSPGTSERRARCCSWRPRRPQSPECWLQGSLLLSHCLETDSYNLKART